MILWCPLQAQDQSWLLCCSFGLKFQCSDMGWFGLGLWPCWLVYPWAFGLLACSFETQLLHYQIWNPRYQWCSNLCRIVCWCVHRVCPGRRRCGTGLWRLDQPQLEAPLLDASEVLLCFGTRYLVLWTHHQRQLHWENVSSLNSLGFQVLCPRVLIA